MPGLNPGTAGGTGAGGTGVGLIQAGAADAFAEARA